MLYGYSQRPLNGSMRGRNWSSYNDPAIMDVMPAPALPQVPELPWLQTTPCPKGARVVADVDRDFVPAGQTYIISDTGLTNRCLEIASLPV